MARRRNPGQSESDLFIDVAKVVPHAEIRVPDLTQAVEGWRSWGIPTKPPAFGVAPKMYSVTWRDYFWAPMQTNMASCCYGCGDSHIPGEDCACGFYSAKTLKHLVSMSYHLYDAESGGRFNCIGKVANWGKVIEGSQGWRAQYAYPTEIYVPFEAWRLAAPLGKAYGIPVKLKNVLDSRMA